jgi:hypothetical protein
MRTWTVRGAFVAGLAVAGLALGATAGLGQAPPGPQAPAQKQTQQQRAQAWDRQAEQSFMLGPGMGRQLMTQEEWAEHQQKMRTMTAQEREQYRQEIHARMQERAKEKGITLPDTPRGPMSGGPASGMGPGTGRGPGMGPGPGAGTPGGGPGKTK